MKNNNLINRILVALAAVVVIVYFYPHQESNRYFYEQGRPWNYAKLIAPFDIPIHPDSATILAARDSLNARFVPIYELNQLIIDTIVASLPDRHTDPSASRLASELRKIYASGVVDMGTKDLIDNGQLPRVRILDKNILSEMPTASLSSPRDVYLYLDSTITDPKLRQYFTHANLHNLLQPNYTRNEEECRRNYEYDYLTLTADRGIILQGQTIIDKGAVITSQDFTNLRTYETMLAQSDTTRDSNRILMMLGQFFYVALIMGALVIYFHLFVPAVWKNFKAFVFMFVLITFFFLMAVGMNYFLAQGIYLTPIMIVPVLVLVFFDDRTALYVTAVTTLVCAPVTTLSLEFLFLQFCAGCASVYSLRELSRRAQLLRTSVVVALVYVAAYTVLELMMNGSFEGFSRRMVIFLVANALLTSMVYVLMSLAERIFGFISVVTLVELADINNPLLMRLSNECPGTFQHSIAVSNLASDAVARIKGNVQLVRAGALYHDIGKLANPAFFTENQHGVNPHDALPPERSAAIVVSHVTDGLKLAEKAGLPAEIQNFIREHHGAGMAKYFYFTYLKNHPEGADKSLFSYPGPNPQRRESSVLMMADAVEAASRSLKEHTREAIAELVNKIIDGQIADGLHNESNLEFRDVQTIKEAFIKRLMTIYHSRIAYPAKPAGA